jgi:hypothetical protein
MTTETEALPAESTALMRAAVQSMDALTLTREPATVLAEAERAATALMHVMSRKPNRIVFNGEQYLENEDWQTIGHFYGLTALIESDRFVEFGSVKGWEATAIVQTRDARIIGREVSMCLDDEAKWSARPKYEFAYCLGKGDDHTKHEHSVEEPATILWEPNPNKPGKSRPRKHRVQMGLEPVPLFQLRSMAHTRASSRAFASVLRFVPVLAGYKPTPAEELPDAERVAQADPMPDPPLGPRPIEGDVVPAEEPPPLGYLPGGPGHGLHLLTNPRMEGGFHVWTVPNWAGSEHTISVSTKLTSVIAAAERACFEKKPVRLKVTMRRDRKDAAYLNDVFGLDDPPASPPDAGPLTKDDIPF